MPEIAYRQIRKEDMPGGLVWTTPERNQGQIVETSYSTGVPGGKNVNYEADDGDPYMRQIDHSDGHTSYYRR